MKNKLLFWQTAGFIFTSVMGTLLHFLYEWSNNSILIAPFSAVNESIFEHMKLLYFPLLIFSIIQYKFIGRYFENFWYAKLIGTTLGLLIIPTLFYTYTGAFGVMKDWFNITIFFIAAAITYYTETKILKSRKCSLPSAISLFILILIGIVFIVLTFSPPKLPLFIDPITKLYGII